MLLERLGGSPWWDEDHILWLVLQHWDQRHQAAPPPPVPAGIPESGIHGTCGGSSRDHSQQRQHLALEPLSLESPVGTIPGSPGAALIQAKGTGKAKPACNKCIFLQELGKGCGNATSSGVRGCLLPTELGAQEPNARHREHNVTSGESRKAGQALLAPPSSLEGKKSLKVPRELK